MMIHVANVLTAQELGECRRLVQEAQWVDGKVTAGFQSAMTKNNLQLPEESPHAQRMGRIVLDAIARHPVFMSAALPAQVFPPLFNCYQGGQSFGMHVDNALRRPRGSTDYVRTDLSATLFFCSPDEYDGGELIVEDTYGAHSVKLPAGDLILYPSTSLHRVEPVTRGARVCSFFWVQSLVRDDGERSLLFELDTSIQQLNAELGPANSQSVRLTGVYHNLLRRWATP